MVRYKLYFLRHIFRLVKAHHLSEIQLFQTELLIIKYINSKSRVHNHLRDVIIRLRQGSQYGSLLRIDYLFIVFRCYVRCVNCFVSLHLKRNTCITHNSYINIHFINILFQLWIATYYMHQCLFIYGGKGKGYYYHIIA